MKSFFRHLFFLSTFLLLTNAIQCYFPDGSESSDIACSTTETSACCGRGSACLSNGLCMHTKYNGAAEPQGSWYGRGSCTDLSWKSEKCPQYCIQKGRDVRNNGMGVNKCDAEGDNEQYYWCANNATKGMDSKEACSNATNYFTIKGEDPTTVTIAGITGVTLNPTSVATPPANSTTAATSPATTTPSPPNSQPSKDYSGAIGAGVGVPLGFLAIGIIGYLLWRNRRNNARSYNQAPPYQTTDPYNEWMAMKNQPTPSLPIEQYKHQAETNVAGERRSSVHQLPTAEHFEPQELASGRSW